MKSIQGYRVFYARLLRLYSKAFCERFGEGMEQTFNDLLRERARSKRNVFWFALWLFLETWAGIFRENLPVFMMKNKNILRIALVTACLLMVPLVAMQFDTGVNWTRFDFLVAGSLLFGSGLAYELVSRRVGNFSYKAAVALAVVAALLLVWVNLAVGIIGTERNRANLMYLGVIAIGVVGAVMARMKPHGMARALFATAVAQVLVPAIALIFWMPVLTSEPPGVFGVFVLNGFFGALFASSGLLFRRASKPIAAAS